MIDNHIYWGNALDIDLRTVVWRRVLDMNDRALRQIATGLGGGSTAPARNRVRHHGRLGSDGDALPAHDLATWKAPRRASSSRPRRRAW